MYVKLDDDTFDNVVLSYLKASVETVMAENEHMKHPEDRAYNARLLPALLTVIQYFSIPNEFDNYIYEVFDDVEDVEDDDDDNQRSFNYGGNDE